MRLPISCTRLSSSSTALVTVTGRSLCSSAQRASKLDPAKYPAQWALLETRLAADLKIGASEALLQSERRPVPLADCFLIAAAGADDSVATADGPVAEAAREEGIAVHALPDSGGDRP